MSQLTELTKLVNDFRELRDWRQFHNPKDLALSLSLEAGEVLEHFQWKTREQVQEYLRGAGKNELKKEMADVLIYLLYLASDLDIDLDEAVRGKLHEQALKYPVEKSRGRATKYTELE